MVLYCLRHYYCLVFCVCSRSVVLKDLRYFYFKRKYFNSSSIFTSVSLTEMFILVFGLHYMGCYFLCVSDGEKCTKDTVLNQLACNRCLFTPALYHL